MFGMNAFQNYQAVNKYPTPYQFPSSSVAINPFLSNDDLGLGANNQVYGLKFGNEPMYGHSGLETQSHYGPPMMASNKGGKLKGAALSALTLLAFLFFLNLLQSCLKDQMDTMNPTVSYSETSGAGIFSESNFQVMVMSAGQRTYLLSRNDGLTDEMRKNGETFDDEILSEEILTDNNDHRGYEDDYVELQSASENVRKHQQSQAPKRKGLKNKSNRSKLKTGMTQISTIEA